MADLIFGRPRHTGGPVQLVFGSGPSTVVPDPVTVTGTTVLGGVSGYGLVAYDNRNPRRASVSASLPHQVASAARGELCVTYGRATEQVLQASDAWRTAVHVRVQTALPWEASARAATDRATAWLPGLPSGRTWALSHQSAAVVSAAATAQWDQGGPASATWALAHERATWLNRVASGQWEVAAHQHVTRLSVWGTGQRRGRTLIVPWERARPVPPGREVWPLVGLPPTLPRVPSTHLVFACPPRVGGSVHLVFGRVCTLPPSLVTVPVRAVYMTINTFSLVRLDNGFPIPATSMSLGIDVDSWTWNFSFSVNGNLLPFVEPNINGDPVTVQATINGTPLRLLIEKIGRERTFGSSQLRCSGRGIAAALDAPYAPVLSFNNAESRTVRQLLDEILTINNASIGWSIDVFQPTDWLVPSGVFSHTGTHLSALNAVLGAAGAYLQPKNTTNALDVLLRYPTPSWEWALATPDLTLPSAVTSREGIEWVDKPVYDRVFVSGQQGGVSGRYTRTGTAGELLAPPVVDPLITHADAVRQRGRTIISDTGRMANVTLRLPVLAETGIIKPGTMVRYTDGPVERIGLSRSVSVDISMPSVYQNIEVETHAQ